MEVGFTKPKIVLAGVGRFGKNHLRVLKELEMEGLCTLHGVVDMRGAVLEKVRKSHSVKTSTDLNDFLTNDVDAIDIVTPTDTHFAFCYKCLEAGKHVFVEKPLTTSYVQAKQLVQIAEEQRKILMVGHIFRYNSAVRKIKEFMKEGKLGQIYYMFGHFMGLKDPRLDVGAVFNYTVHHIDIYNYLLDKLPEEVTCCIGYFLQRRDFEDVAFLVLRYPPNTLGIVEGSWLPPGKYRDLTVVGSRKSVTSNLLNQTLELHNAYIEAQHGQLKAVDEGSTKIDIRFEEPLKLELLDFIKCIKTGRKPLADGRTALSVIKTAEKAIESAQLGRSVRIDENE
jgi:UDP-N-acetylglucosamine 3-dehydrogenase